MQVRGFTNIQDTTNVALFCYQMYRFYILTDSLEFDNDCKNMTFPYFQVINGSVAHSDRDQNEHIFYVIANKMKIF